jgi:two-component system, cell cycle sensor histidine kinase and response regulator CckA
MATTFGDPVASVEHVAVIRRDVSLSEALAEAERLGRELEQERVRGRRLEEDLREARRLEAVGRLAGGVAHDFSNILAVITGYSELMLKRMDPTDPLRTGAESIRKAAVWGLNLTQHMLTTSRVTVPVPSTLDVNPVTAGVLRTIQPLLGEHVEVVLQLDPHVGRVTVNSGQLEQTLMNLVLNARDAMPDGGRITIETGNVVRAESQLGPSRAVFVRVSDTGCGMDPATLSRAFEPYFTTKAPGKGTGLGLATVFAFVTQSGGHVDVVSEVGQGSAFTLYLPRVDPGDEAVTFTPPDTTTVLVVEPEAGVRDLIGEILEIHGYHVLTARDADEAVAVCVRHHDPVALVIADLLSPGVAGDGLLYRLGRGHAIPKAIYLSGDLQDTVEEYRGLDPGRGFLHKPFTVDALVHKVQAILATG